MEEIERLLKAIHRTAEIVREHLEIRTYRNHLTTVGIESIISMAKEAIEMVEQTKRQVKNGLGLQGSCFGGPVFYDLKATPYPTTHPHKSSSPLSIKGMVSTLNSFLCNVERSP